MSVVASHHLPTVRATPRVTVDGEQVSLRTRELLREAYDAAGISVAKMHVIQGSWSGAKASAGTHAGGGAVDLRTIGLMPDGAVLALVQELRKRGCAAWWRCPAYGWPASAGGPHLHLIVRDEPGLSSAARGQVVAYERGLNALASKLRDPHPRPDVTPYRLFGAVPAFPGGSLGRGSQGRVVAALQRALEITPDGDYGPVTVRRVARFQAARPRLWKPDGICGPKTYAAAIEWGWR